MTLLEFIAKLEEQAETTWRKAEQVCVEKERRKVVEWGLEQCHHIPIPLIDNAESRKQNCLTCRQAQLKVWRI